MIETLASQPWQLASLAAVLLVAGSCGGLLAGLLGVGGGIVIVPVLYMLFPFLDIAPEIRMHLAVGTSLATIIPTSVMSARSHYKRGGVDLELLKTWGPWILVGALIGTYLGGRVAGEVLTLIFAVVALLVAANMAFRPDGMTLAPAFPRGLLRGILGLVIGGFSVMMGIGGGTLSVPLLTAFSYPVRRAVGTAAAVGLIIALPGAFGFMLAGWGHNGLPPLSLGYVNLLGFALIVPTSMAMAPLGAKIAHAIRPKLLRWLFALFLLLTALRMFYGVVT
jgi:uncharacterized membrane protein YfcA